MPLWVRKPHVPYLWFKIELRDCQMNGLCGDVEIREEINIQIRNLISATIRKTKCGKFNVVWLVNTRAATVMIQLTG
jgi:hypothetical protein